MNEAVLGAAADVGAGLEAQQNWFALGGALEGVQGVDGAYGDFGEDGAEEEAGGEEKEAAGEDGGGDDRLGQGGVPADRVAAQAFSSFGHATIVTVGRNAQVAEPIEITVRNPNIEFAADGATWVNRR